MLPTADAWQSGSESVSYESQFGSRADFRYRNLPTRRDGQLSVRERMNRSWWPGTSWLMWLFAKTSLAVLGATLSLMILMPFEVVNDLIFTKKSKSLFTIGSRMDNTIARRYISTMSIAKKGGIVVTVFFLIPAASKAFAHDGPLLDKGLVLGAELMDHKGTNELIDVTVVEGCREIGRRTIKPVEYVERRFTPLDDAQLSWLKDYVRNWHETVPSWEEIASSVDVNDILNPKTNQKVKF